MSDYLNKLKELGSSPFGRDALRDEAFEQAKKTMRDMMRGASAITDETRAKFKRLERERMRRLAEIPFTIPRPVYVKTDAFELPPGKVKITVEINNCDCQKAAQNVEFSEVEISTEQ